MKIGFVPSLVVALLVAPAAAADLETLDPTAAHERITSSEGVVFVDLFAEW